MNFSQFVSEDFTIKNANVISLVQNKLADFVYHPSKEYGTESAKYEVMVRFDDGKEVKASPSPGLRSLKVGDRVSVKIIKNNDARKKEYKSYGVTLPDFDYRVTGILLF